ncbi:HAD family hydrolase [Maribacter algarum]|uniref:HAD family hydrolase n=1 Tax=Maribacter algarum (ex Zhang et al. 2020) TaxID=2578118 RepID=A0A5S3PHP8_9FLAO|nr:HAD hydrolase-like protein [Maribacter algarum]TMM53805.1 HAD family hydrolase [Maribacter algarum]
MKTLLQKIESKSSCKVVFTDFFDTLVHRIVHPHYTIKLWGKFMIRELGLLINADELFAIRIDSLSHLSNKLFLKTIEVPYEELQIEVYRRLINAEVLPNTSFEHFCKIFTQADLVSETSVQFKNESLVHSLKEIRGKGYRIYLITDFFLPHEIISKILEYHGMLGVFNAIFVSCDLKKSKESGSIYPEVLELTNSSPAETIMVGDNKKSDIINAQKHEIEGIHTKNLRHHFRNKRNLMGNDNHNFDNVCETIEKTCAKSKYPFSEYIIHFYFFTERLYKKARRDGVKDLFFLAREGLYLKKLFDFYQELNQFNSKNQIRTHYLKASRQSAQQVALKPLEEEDFKELGGMYNQMSIDQLLTWFLFPEKLKKQLIDQLGIKPEQNFSNLFTSELMSELRKNEIFVTQYEKNRVNQKEAFMKYLTSFGADIEKNGISLVDVGWGGTMQECIHKFLNKEVPVTGYYIGLKAIYNIEPDTKRFGLNFSLYPSHGVSYDILKANGQLYEQLLGAPHGSTLGYKLENGQPETIEFHEESEKYVFDNYVKDVQSYMFGRFEELFLSLRSIDYSQVRVQEYMTSMAMRTGILTNKKRIRFINNISKGFYQNVGENKVGLNYNPKQLSVSKRSLVYKFIRSPEKVFRYLVKVKPFLYAKGLYWCSWPVNLAYYYMKFNFWVKKTWFPKRLLRS